MEERLNLINHLKSKYGNSVADILASYEQKQEKLEQLGNYEFYVEQLKKQIEDKKQHILEICETLSGLRKEAAEPLSQKLKAAMIDLNFIDVQFDIEVTSDPDHFHADGYDKIEFLISVNPGEAMRPIWQVASGGELSRIMLAFKTVFADKEDTATLILMKLTRESVAKRHGRSRKKWDSFPETNRSSASPICHRLQPWRIPIF